MFLDRTYSCGVKPSYARARCTKVEHSKNDMLPLLIGSRGWTHNESKVALSSGAVERELNYGWRILGWYDRRPRIEVGEDDLKAG